MDFIQIGANIGNSKEDIIWPLVNKKAWKGLFIEPLPTEFKTLCKNYAHIKSCLFENCAIMDYDGKVKLHFNETSTDTNKQASTITTSRHARWNPDEVEVACKTLMSVCQQYDLIKSPLELLQIDAEGADSKILLCTDFFDLYFKYIRFEKVHLTENDIINTINHLKRFGYEPIEDMFSSIPGEKNFDIVLKREL